MSTQIKPDYAAEALSEESVHDFLEDNPDFFERHSSLLGTLRLPHVTGGTVSLVERQVSVLRQKDVKLERRLKDLLKVARANDVLAGKIHQLSISLLGEKSLASTLTAIEQALRVNFDAEQSVLVKFGAPEDFASVEKSRFFRAVERDDESLGAFSTFLEADTPRCGQIRDAQRDFLFPGNGEEVGSVALVPLGSKSAAGFLAIGSVDASRFHPGMSIDFLARIGDLVAAALCRF